MNTRVLILAIVLAAALGGVLVWTLHKCPERTEVFVDRSGIVADSLDTARRLAEKDSIIAAQAFEIATRTPTYIRLENGTRTLTLAPDDSIGAILDRKPVSKY